MAILPSGLLVAVAVAAIVVAVVVLVLLVLLLDRRRGETPSASAAPAPSPVAASAPPSPIAFAVEIGELLRSGRKIEAIKRYREVTNLGLKEAKDAVEALERGVDLPVPAAAAAPNAPPAGSTASMAEVERLVHEKQLIMAIKVYRELTGVGLKEAKDAVEAIRDRR